MRSWIKSFVIVTSLLLVSCIPPPLSSNSESTNISPDLFKTSGESVEVQSVLGEAFEVLDASNLSVAEQRARRSAVKVRSMLAGGHGSGTYMIASGRRVVVTAAHVVRSESVMAIDGRDDETVVGRVVFVDYVNDIAFLVVPEMKTRTAVKYRPFKSYDERLIGAHLTYTGFPSHHNLLTIRGYVAALEHEMIVTNMFGWFGASGSGVFDNHGRLIGVVSGIDIGNIGIRIPLDSIVWVAPMSTIDHEMIKIRIKSAERIDTINAFPGAAAPRRGAPNPR